MTKFIFQNFTSEVLALVKPCASAVFAILALVSPSYEKYHPRFFDLGAHSAETTSSTALLPATTDTCDVESSGKSAGLGRFGTVAGGGFFPAESQSNKLPCFESSRKQRGQWCSARSFSDVEAIDLRCHVKTCHFSTSASVVLSTQKVRLTNQVQEKEVPGPQMEMK